MLADANVLLTLAVILIAGTVSGNLAKLLHLPSVTGQIVAGVLMGASVFNVLTEESLHSLQPLVDFALGLMAVAVGTHLNFSRLKVARRRLLMLLLLEATLTPLIVYSGLIIFTDITSSTALLLATLAISTAPATVLAIVKETASKGSFVMTLLAGVALNNLACIILFELARTVARTAVAPNAPVNFMVPLGAICQSLLLGFAIGVLLIIVTLRVVRTDRLSALSLIAILLTTGLTEYLELSVLLACLCMG
ncbi:MAG: cation:proton antiporter, partial [Fuerstiella sp.]